LGKAAWLIAQKPIVFFLQSSLLTKRFFPATLQLRGDAAIRRINRVVLLTCPIRSVRMRSLVVQTA